MKPIVKVPLINGAIAGALGAILMIALYYMGTHPFLIPIYFDFRILLFIFFLFFTLREFRDMHQEGILYFWQGLIMSFIFVITFGLLAGAILGLFASMEPEFLQSFIRLQMQQIRGLPQEVIERIGKDVYDSNLNALPSTNNFDLTTIYLRQSVVIGLPIGIIMSVIARRTT